MKNKALSIKLIESTEKQLKIKRSLKILKAIYKPSKDNFIQPGEKPYYHKSPDVKELELGENFKKNMTDLINIYEESIKELFNNQEKDLNKKTLSELFDSKMKEINNGDKKNKKKFHDIIKFLNDPKTQSLLEELIKNIASLPKETVGDFKTGKVLANEMLFYNTLLNYAADFGNRYQMKAFSDATMLNIQNFFTTNEKDKKKLPLEESFLDEIKELVEKYKNKEINLQQILIAIKNKIMSMLGGRNLDDILTYTNGVRLTNLFFNLATGNFSVLNTPFQQVAQGFNAMHASYVLYGIRLANMLQTNVAPRVMRLGEHDNEEIQSQSRLELLWNELKNPQTFGRIANDGFWAMNNGLSPFITNPYASGGNYIGSMNYDVWVAALQHYYKCTVEQDVKDIIKRRYDVQHAHYMEKYQEASNFADPSTKPNKDKAVYSQCIQHERNMYDESQKNANIISKASKSALKIALICFVVALIATVLGFIFPPAWAVAVPAISVAIKVCITICFSVMAAIMVKQFVIPAMINFYNFVKPYYQLAKLFLSKSKPALSNDIVVNNVKNTSIMQKSSNIVISALKKVGTFLKKACIWILLDRPQEKPQSFLTTFTENNNGQAIQLHGCDQNNVKNSSINKISIIKAKDDFNIDYGLPPQKHRNSIFSEDKKIEEKIKIIRRRNSLSL